MHKPDEKDTLRATVQAALESGDEKQFTDALLTLCEHIQGNVLDEAKQAAFEGQSDAVALAARGVKPLTAAERKYFNTIIDGNINSSAFDGTEALVPPTVINRVFEELKQNHELLSHINMQPVGPTTEWILKKGDIPLAFWGKLSRASEELLDEGFTTMRFTQALLTCFLPVGQSMLKLGPEWLARYVNEVLSEAMALGMEDAIVNGDGADRPIGITRDVDNASHPLKSATAITDLQPVTLGTNVMAPLSHNGRRTVNDVIMVVNPLDYWEKIFGATTFLNAAGQYVPNILPIPARFVQSPAMPRGLMSAGIAKDYFMGVAFKTGIQYSDEYRFIERERVYKTDIAANGQPVDNNAFLLFDISGLLPSLTQTVTTKAKA